VSDEKNVEVDNVELIDYLRVIWKRKVLVIGATFVSIIAAVILSFLLPKVYEASVIFLLEESKIARGLTIPGINPTIIGTYGKTYEGIIKNKNLLVQVVKKSFNLTKNPIT